MTESFREDMYERPVRRSNTPEEERAGKLIWGDMNPEERWEYMKEHALMLPEEDQCPECKFFRLTDEVVMKIKAKGGKPSQAECRCPSEQQVKAKVSAAKRVLIYQANLPHEALIDEQKFFDEFRMHNGHIQAGYDAVQGLLRDDSEVRIVTLWGGSGTGKSHLLEAAGRFLLANNKRVRYVTAIDFSDEYRTANKPDEIFDDVALTDYYRGFDFIFLDDLGKDRATEFSVEKITNLIDYIYANEGKLIVATNGDEGDIARKYGKPVASRLFDATTGIVKSVGMVGQDRRLYLLK